MTSDFFISSGFWDKVHLMKNIISLGCWCLPWTKELSPWKLLEWFFSSSNYFKEKRRSLMIFKLKCSNFPQHNSELSKCSNLKIFLVGKINFQFFSQGWNYIIFIYVHLFLIKFFTDYFSILICKSMVGDSLLSTDFSYIWFFNL